MVANSNTVTRGGFAERLRTLRKARGFRTAKSFAEVLAIDQNTYTRYERGEVEPNLAVLARIWDLLDLPKNSLIGGDDTAVSGMIGSEYETPARVNEPILRYTPTPSSHANLGFADNGGVDYEDAPANDTGRGKLSLIEAKAWRLAQLMASSGVGLELSERKSSLAIVRETAAHFRALSTTPFDTIAKFSADKALDAADGKQRDLIAQQLSEYAALVAQEMLGA